ncbi:MAG: ornithine cyclodeaminase family protein [Kiloniellales bacterium]
MLVIGAQQVRDALDYGSLVDGLERRHREAPPRVDRLLMEQPTESGDPDFFLIWQAWQPGRALGSKLATGFPRNAAEGKGLPTVQAVYLLFDGRDGRPWAMIDGTELTYWKTAADSALGARYLARSDAGSLLMVGAGAMAPHLVRAHRAVRPSIERVTIWNRSAAKAEHLAEALRGEGLAARATGDLKTAAAQADVICCATASRAPLIEGAWLRPGAHLDLVGGFTNAMREADDAAARRARIFVDSRWFTIGQCGDITGPLESGAITEADVLGDLFELCQGKVEGRRGAEEITFFKNAGGAHLDLMTAELIVARVSPKPSDSVSS